ncbi:hypothetical protein E3T29_01395 [Cryobacterium sp. TMT1-66-1]|nr:hypothetical protein E3T29_01395 [Cryobacterium sp. TMT1-66-1]
MNSISLARSVSRNRSGSRRRSVVRSTVSVLDEIDELYRERKTAAVVLAVDPSRNLNQRPNSSEETAIGAARNNDMLIAFGSVDPTRGAGAITQALRLAGDFGVRGFKFHPTVQTFNPSDEQFYPLWAALQDLGLPALFYGDYGAPNPPVRLAAQLLRGTRR